MENKYHIKSYYFSCENLILKAFFILILICFLSSLYPIKAEAIPVTDTKSGNISDGFSHPPLFEKINMVDHSTVNEVKIYLNNGNYNAALAMIDELSGKEKNKPEIISLKITALIGKNEFSSAMAEYKILKDREDTTSKNFSQIADMLLLKKKPLAAMMVCQSGLMRDIKSVKLLYQMGYCYNMLGKPNVALAYYQGAKSANNVTPELKQKNITRAIALSYYKLYDFENARKTLKKYNVEDTDSGIKMIIDAKYYASKGNYDEAISLLDKAHNSSKSLEADLIKAQLLILNSNPDEAIHLLNDLDRLYGKPNFLDVLKLTKSLAFLSVSKSEKSLDLLENIEHPDKINNIHMLKAITYFSLGKQKKVIEELKQTSLPYSELASSPEFERYLNQPSLGPDIGMAFFCLDQKYYLQAVAIAHEAAKKSKKNVLLNFLLAESYLLTENHSLAIKNLVKINDVFKHSFALKFYLSQAYAKAGMLDEATKTYKLLTGERPDFIKADLVYGKLLGDFSKWDEARKVYENGLNFMPDSPLLQISLGWTLVHLKKLDSLNGLLQIMEKNKKIGAASFLHLKGWTAFLNNNYSEAEELLTKAIEASPGDPEICFHLGMTLMKSGKQGVATNLLQQSLLFEKQRKKYYDVIKKNLFTKK